MTLSIVSAQGVLSTRRLGGKHLTSQSVWPAAASKVACSEAADTKSVSSNCTHSYGTGDIKDCVQLDSTGPTYKTNFKRGDVGASGPASYTAKVYFLDVDGNDVLQAMSNAVTF
jgi:hypothetical protein